MIIIIKTPPTQYRDNVYKSITFILKFENITYFSINDAIDETKRIHKRFKYTERSKL